LYRDTVPVCVAVPVYCVLVLVLFGVVAVVGCIVVVYVAAFVHVPRSVMVGQVDVAVALLDDNIGAVGVADILHVVVAVVYVLAYTVVVYVVVYIAVVVASLY